MPKSIPDLHAELATRQQAVTAAEAQVATARSHVRDGSTTRADLQAAEDALNLERGLLESAKADLEAALQAKAASDHSAAVSAATNAAQAELSALETALTSWDTAMLEAQTALEAKSAVLAANRDSAQNALSALGVHNRILRDLNAPEVLPAQLPGGGFAPAERLAHQVQVVNGTVLPLALK